MEKDKKGLRVCQATRDGRMHVTLQFAATCTRGKSAFVCVVAAALLLFILAPFFGVPPAETQRRLTLLEEALAQRLSWVATHQTHLSKHVMQRSWSDVSGDAVLHDDARRHLWTEPGMLSRLGEALVTANIDTTLPQVD